MLAFLEDTKIIAKVLPGFFLIRSSAFRSLCSGRKRRLGSFHAGENDAKWRHNEPLISSSKLLERMKLITSYVDTKYSTPNAFVG